MQNLLDKLISNKIRDITEERKVSLLKYFSRLLSTNFQEELETPNQMEYKLVRQSGKNKNRVLELITNLKNKRTLSQKENIMKCLLKISEDSNGGVMQNFSDFTTKHTIFNTDSTKQYQTNNSFKYASNILTNHSSNRMVIEEPKTHNKLFKAVVATFQALQTEYFNYDKKLEIFVIKPKYESLVSLSVLKFLCRINEIGWLYLRLDHYLNSSKKKALQFTLQSCISSVREELEDFYYLMADFENYQKTNDFNNCNFVGFLQLRYDHLFDKIRNLTIIVDKAIELKASEILSMLFLMSKNSFIERVSYLKNVFKKTARPLLEFLNNWICRGEIQDTMGEFFIKDNQNCNKPEDYWNDGLIFYRSRIPYFIDESSARMIFIVGKVIKLLKKIDLNLVKLDVKPIELDELVAHTNNLNLHNKLQKVYAKKNKTLLDYLFKEKGLMSTLEFWKGIFFTIRGDLINTFIRNLDEDIGLKHLSSSINHQIYFALENAVRTCFGNKHTMMDSLSIRYIDVDQAKQTIDASLRFFANFTFVVAPYQAPLNYFFSSKNQLIYQNCFKYLFTLKIEQYELKKLWRLHSKNKLETNAHLSSLLRISSKVRTKMLSFTDALLAYWLNDCINQEWDIMQEEMEKGKELDDWLKAHDLYLRKISMLIDMTEPGAETKEMVQRKERYDLLLNQLLELIWKFKESQISIFESLKKNMHELQNESLDSIDKLENDHYEGLLNISAQFSLKMNKLLKNIENKFVESVVNFINFLKEKRASIKIDFNDYYTMRREYINSKSKGGYYMGRGN